MAFKFEKLIAWQKAIEYSFEIFEKTKDFPKDEVYGLTSQLRRASDSIALNIAEGSMGNTNKEFVRFLKIANRSTAETVSALHIAKRKGYLDNEEFKRLYELVEEQFKINSGLINSIKKDV